VQTMEPNPLVVRQGRMLAMLATIFVPSLIAVMGFDRGYPLETIGVGLLIWVVGTIAWIAYSWRWLKPDATTAW
jgi:hypothetical protein